MEIDGFIVLLIGIMLVIGTVGWYVAHEGKK
jgi:hypothetical protein